jgi:hypothetical protein
LITTRHPEEAAMTFRPSQRADVVVEDLDDELCLYRPDVDEVVVLNATAGDVWRLADGEQDSAEIVDLLAASYGQPAAAIRDEVLAALRELLDHGYLIDVAGAPEPGSSALR